MLTAEQKKELERLQRLCVRIIYGWGRDYKDLLQEKNLETLETRRENMCLNFAKKCLENEHFKSWFPLEHNKEHELRAVRKYALPNFNCLRYDKSPLNYMRRLLNEEHCRDS